LNTAKVAFLRTASGYSHSRKLISALSASMPAEPMCFPVHLIPPDEDDRGQGDDAHIGDQSRTNIQVTNACDDEPRDDGEDDEGATMTMYEFGVDDIALIERDDLQKQDQVHSQDPSSLLLHWHYRMVHLYKVWSRLKLSRLL
jgi:hypothetical protein